MGSMRGALPGDVVHRLEQLFNEGSLSGFSEGQLLDRFTTSHDESAFEVLVERHGPMVLGVCRQFLRDPHDVDDAFQATFLVLVRKAGSLKRKELLGNWLYGVATRVALRSRALAVRRQSRMALVADIDTCAGDGRSDPARSGLEAILQADERPLLLEEVNKLPRKYREPIVLCYFEGLTHDQVAARLGWPVGTVKGRLSRARDLLRVRLSRHGVTVSSAALLAFSSSSDLRAAVPLSLAQSTFKAALAVLASSGIALVASSAVSLSVASLTEGVIQAMVFSQVKSLVIPALVAAGVLTAGVSVVALQPGPRAARQPRNQPPAVPHREPNPSAVPTGGGQDEAQLARTVMRVIEDLSASGKQNDPESYHTWSLRLLEEEKREAPAADTSPTVPYEGHLKRMRRMLEIYSARANAARGTAYDVARGKFFVKEAERMLEDAKRGGSMVGQMMGGMGGRMMGGMMSGMMRGAGAGGAGMAMTGPAVAPGEMPPAPPAGQPPSESHAQPAPAPVMGGGFGGSGEVPDEASDYILIARMSAAISTIDKNPQSQAVLKKLDEPTSLHFAKETPLEEVLKQIKESSKRTGGRPIPIYVDPLGLQEAEKTLTSPVTIDLEDVPLRFSLRHLLKQLGMAYCVHDGVLIISSVEGIKRELQEAQAEQMGLNPDTLPGMIGGFMGGMGGMGGMKGGSGMM